MVFEIASDEHEGNLIRFTLKRICLVLRRRPLGGVDFALVRDFLGDQSLTDIKRRSVYRIHVRTPTHLSVFADTCTLPSNIHYESC